VAREPRNASTDDLRLAVIHDRALFDELLEGAPSTPRVVPATEAEARPPARH
jgi:hypothetical protein